MPGHLGGHDHRRPAAPGDGRARSGGARRARARSARRPSRRSRAPTSGAPAPVVVSGNRDDAPSRRRVARRPSTRRRRICRRRRAAARRCTWATWRRVADGGGEPDSYVMQHPRRGEAYPAVTLSIAKRKGTNAIALTRARRAQGRHGARLPAARATCTVSVTRNYGETAAQKSNELLWHMLLAVVSVSALDLARARPPRSRPSCSPRFR